MCIGDRQASCASWQQALDLSVFRMLNLFSFHLISSHRSFSWKLLTASHCHRSLCHPISSQLISCLLSFSPHLSSSHLISALRTSCHLISAHLVSFHFLRNQLALLWYFMAVHLMSKHLTSSSVFLTLAIQSLSQTQQDTAAVFSMQTTRKVQSNC